MVQQQNSSKGIRKTSDYKKISEILLLKITILILGCRNRVKKLNSVAKTQRIIPQLCMIGCDATPVILVLQPFNKLTRDKFERVWKGAVGKL